VLGNDTDPENDSLTPGVVSGPANGILSLGSDGSFTYTPNANFSGSDSFTYIANDGELDSNFATVSITVNDLPPPNTPPVATGDSYSTDEGVTLIIGGTGVLGNDSDADNDPLTAILISGPANGGLSFSSSGIFDYFPNSGFSGSDSFTYQVSDGTDTSDPVTVTITVNDLPPAPVANGDAYSVDEDASLWISAPGVLGNDTGESLSPAVINNPAHGSVSMSSDGSFSYYPVADYFGADSFTYQLADEVTATVSLTINPVNDAPSLSGSLSYSGPEDTQIIESSGALLAGATDPDGDVLQPVLSGQASNGTVSISSYGSFIYTPNQDFHGSDSFSYYVIDTAGAASSTATVSLTITPVNDAPIAVDDFFTLNEDEMCFTGSVLGNDTDIDGDSLQVSITSSNTGNGYVSYLSGGYFQYTPNLNFSGGDSFSYQLSDGFGGTSSATVYLWVTEVNDAPIASPDAYSVDEDGYLSVSAAGVLGNDTDADSSGPLTVFVQQGPQNGQLQMYLDGSFTYTPNANFHGTDSFGYQAYDYQTGSNTVTVTITVNPVNDAPLVTGESYTLNEDEPLSTGSLLANDSDIEGDFLTTSLLDSPAHGTVTLDGSGYFTYTPNLNYNISLNNNIPDSFTYLVSDAYSQTMGTVTLTVNPVNDAPTAADHTFSLEEDTPISISSSDLLAGASDPENDSLSITMIGQPQHGTLAPDSSGGYTYTPNVGYNGLDSFTYTAFDGNMSSLLATATLAIAPIDDSVVTVVVDSSSIDEPGSPIGTAYFTISRTETVGDLWVSYELIGEGTRTLATYGEDFTASPEGTTGTAFLADGAAAAVIAVTAVNDPKDDDGESVRLQITGLSGDAAEHHEIGDQASATVAIIDEDTVTIVVGDAPPQYESLGVTKLQEHADRRATFTVTVRASSGTLEQELEVVVRTVSLAGDTATATSDYQAFTKTVRFSQPGTIGIQVPLYFDMNPDAPHETFSLEVVSVAYVSAGPTDPVIDDGVGKGDIVDVPHFKIRAESVGEEVTEPAPGEEGFAKFKIIGDAPTPDHGGYGSVLHSVMVTYNISAVSPTFHIDADTLVSPSWGGTIEIWAGRVVEFSIPIAQDYKEEGVETFSFNITSAVPTWDDGMMYERINDTINVLNREMSRVWIESVSATAIWEGGEVASSVVTFRRTMPDLPIDVDFQVTVIDVVPEGCCPVGSIAAQVLGGDDVVVLPSSVVHFDAGQETATVEITAIDDTVIELTQKIIVDVAYSSANSPYYPELEGTTIFLGDNDSGDDVLTSLDSQLRTHIDTWYTNATNRIQDEIANGIEANGWFWDFVKHYQDSVREMDLTLRELRYDIVNGLASLADSAPISGGVGIGTGLVKAYGKLEFGTSTPNAEKIKIATLLQANREEAIGKVSKRRSGAMGEPVEGYDSKLNYWSNQYRVEHAINRQEYLARLLCLQDELNRDAPLTQPPARNSLSYYGELLLGYATTADFRNQFSFNTTTQQWTTSSFNYPGIGAADIVDNLNNLGYKP
jgi:VCBS repeat-containing protein